MNAVKVLGKRRIGIRGNGRSCDFTRYHPASPRQQDNRCLLAVILEALTAFQDSRSMPDSLQCYRCGASLDALSLPLSRQDQCPQCANYLHVCRMCRNFDPHVARQCREDDAEEVMKKDTANFCDWFIPAPDRHSANSNTDADRARQKLDALFGSSDAGSGDTQSSHSAADDLFRK